MTWPIVFVLAAGVLAQRLIGMFVGGPVLVRYPALGRLATLIPASVVMAVIVQLSVASGTSLVVDARLAGIAVAALLVWRRAPFVAVVVAAAVTTAAVRAFGG
jgi:hypothetical protein